MNQKKIGIVVNTDGTVTLTGTLLLADTPNANGHIFPKEVLEEAFKKAQNKLEKGTLYGHDDLFEENNFGRVKLQNVHSRVKSLNINNEGISVTAELLDTPNGKVWKELIMKQPNISLGFNTCSKGTLDDNNVAKDVEILSFGILPIESFNKE